MPIKLNSHTLTDETLNSMKSVLNKSVQTRKELGFTLCADQKNNLQARNICTGEDCTVDIRVKCDEHEKFAGAYHTHPNSYSMASANDLIFCGTVPNTCIGGEKDKKIKCFTWKHEHITEEKYNDLIRKLNKGIRQIDDPVHEKTFECIKGFGPIVHTEKSVSEEDKKINMISSVIIMAEQEEIPKHKIDDMKKAVEYMSDTRDRIVRKMNERSAKLIPKYYEEKDIEII